MRSELILPGLDGEPVLLTPDNLPVPSLTAEWDDLAIRVGLHLYDSWPIKVLHWHGPREAYERLGLLLLSRSLHRVASETTVGLGDGSSNVTTLRIEPTASGTDAGLLGLMLQPEAFHYAPGPVHAHPWLDDPPALAADLPHFRLTTHDDIVLSEDDLARADTVVGFGGLLATIRFAELLLNFSRPGSTEPEVILECDAGYRGVAPGSVEAHLHLGAG